MVSLTERVNTAFNKGVAAVENVIDLAINAEFKSVSTGTFYSLLTNGLQKGCNYSVTIRYPDMITDRYSKSIDKYNIFCEEIDAPSNSLLTHIHRVNGKSRRVPYAREQADVNMTFMNDGRLRMNEIFVYWMNHMIDQQTNKTMNFEQDYVCDIIIAVLDNTDQVIMKYTLKNAKPINLAPVNYNYGLKNEYTKSQVTFTYDYVVDEFLLSEKVEKILENVTVFGKSASDFIPFIDDVDNLYNNVINTKDSLTNNLRSASNSILDF
jgi:hypothetical protein